MYVISSKYWKNVIGNNRMFELRKYARLEILLDITFLMSKIYFFTP